jgi:hypothetical protein
MDKQNVLPFTGSDDPEQFHPVVRKCRLSAYHVGTCCKGSNPCSVNYNISPKRGQLTMANFLSQQNVMSCLLCRWKRRSIMTKCKKCDVGLNFTPITKLEEAGVEPPYISTT